MPRLSEATIEAIRTASDLVEVVSDYVRLQRTGKNLKGLCPFHDEKTPSFTVNPEEQFYYCFGCGKAGDVFRFLEEIEGISFLEASRVLANRYGIPLDWEGVNPREKEKEKARQLLIEVHKIALRLFRKALQENLEALAYLRRRGLSQEVCSRFMLGYAPDSWDTLKRELAASGIDVKAGIDSGLLVRSSRGTIYDRFRGRIMFPIANEQGEVVAFGGRIIEDEQNNSNSGPKYLNSPETPLYSKGRLLYGWHLARRQMRQTGSAVLVEGYMDAIGLHRAGVTNVVASLGTSLTSEQAALLKRAVERVFIAYDADAAGQRATLRGLQLLSDKGLQVQVVELPPGEDPDSFVARYGQEAFQERLAQSLPLLEYRLKLALAGVDVSTPSGKARAVEQVLPVLAAIPAEVERKAYAQAVAGRIGVTARDILRSLQKSTQDNRNRRLSGNRMPLRRYTKKAQRPDGTPEQMTLPRRLAAEGDILALMLRDHAFCQDLARLGFGEGIFRYQPFRDLAGRMFELYREGRISGASSFGERLRVLHEAGIDPLHVLLQANWVINAVPDLSAEQKREYLQQAAHLWAVSRRAVLCRQIESIVAGDNPLAALNKLLVTYRETTLEMIANIEKDLGDR